MTSSALLGLLTTHKLRIFTTADLITLTGMSPGASTHALSRLEAEGLLARIKRGVWIHKMGADVNPYEAVGHLRAPWPAYVSLYSALADCGAIEEIPQVIYAVSSATPKRYATKIGEFHFHHLPARLIWGYEQTQAGGGTCPIAEPEKAFLDLVYLALTPRSPLRPPRRRGVRWQLDGAKIRRYAKRFTYEPLSAWITSEKFK